MVETIAILLFGIIPGIFSFYLATTATLRAAPPLPQGAPRRDRRTPERSTFAFPSRQPAALPPADAHYVDGLGYIIGDLSCQFNARSPHLRCAVNPSGPCNGCTIYQALQFPEESASTKLNSPEI